MKAAGGPQKLRFTVQSCSGEDSDYPVRELLYHSPQTRGWQSPRFCKFPQEFVLRLERPSKIQQIQILAHEYKIPTKIEVFVGFAGPAAAAAADADPSGGMQLRRLGYLSFDSNERSNHQARELKSVHVSVEAQLVRLLIHRCHVNKLNIYNQVGIVALNLIGEPLQPAPEGPHPYLDVEGHPSHELPYYNRAAAEVADLQLDMHVDSQTAQRIKELACAKEAAVAAEDYDEAKRLKGCIERLKVVGAKVAQLEARKRLAVEREDYDLAKALKVDIEKLRTAGETAAGAASPGAGVDAAADSAAYGAAAAAGPESIISPRDQFGNQVQHQQSWQMRHDDMPVGSAAAGQQPGGVYPEGPEPSAEISRGVVGGSSFKGGAAAAAAYDAAAAVQPVVHTYQAYEDRPAVAKAAYMGQSGPEGLGLDDDALIRADPSTVSAAALFGVRSMSTGGGAIMGGGGGGGQKASMGGARALTGGGDAAAAPPGGASCSSPAPAGWPGDLPPPEPLGNSSAGEAAPVIDVAGEFVAAAFFSRNWQLRDAAAAWLADLVSNGRLNGAGQRDVAKSMLRLAVRGLKDKVPQVYSSCLGLLQALLTALASSGGSRDVHQAIEMALPVLLERLSDNNARLRDSARDALVALAQEPEGSGALRGLTSQLCRPPKSQTAWRPVLAMLQLLQDLVPLLGLSGQGGAGGNNRASTGGDGGFELTEVMDYVGKALNSANAEVRSAALRVAVSVAGCAAGGAAVVRRLLPRDLNPKLKEQADAALGTADANGTAAPMQQTPQPAKTRAGGSSVGGGGGGSRTAGKPSATNSGHPNRQAAAAAAAGHPARNQQPPQQQQQQQQQPLVGLEGEDPAPFVAELAARDQQYGPRHPAVAESCSNLAILYNQQGDYAAALPLYERALAIYEATYGPNHQEVAHTLTDLAVLHLEQGHDAVGRPLLERALAIQEASLGPNHPDVIAIRDVLNSE